MPHDPLPNGLTEIATVSLVDWHIADQSDEGLSDIERLPWSVRLSRNAESALCLDFVRADGSVRTLSVEVAGGDIQAMLGGREDDTFAIARLQADQTFVGPMNPALASRRDEGVAFDADGMHSALHPDHDEEASSTPSL